MRLGDYLTLRLSRLKPTESWVPQGPGLLFIFPRDGLGIWTSGTQQVLSPGDVLVFNSNSAGSLVAHRVKDFVFSFFSISFENLYPLFGTSELRLAAVLEETFKKTKYYPASEPLSLACHKLLAEAPSQFNLDHRVQLLRVVANVLNPEVRNGQSVQSGQDDPEQHILRVFESLSVTEMLQLSVGELAARFGCSRRHLNRLFHEHFGLSVAAMRMEMRLLKAISLLRNPTAKIIHVAEGCGFNHLGLFNTCFKRRFGASPGQWRKAAVNNTPKASDALEKAECPLRAHGMCNIPAKPAARLAPAYRSPETERKFASTQCLVTAKVFGEAQCDATLAITRSAQQSATATMGK